MILILEFFFLERGWLWMEETIRGETENGRGEGVARDRDE